MNIEKMLKYGNEWEKGMLHRIYFDLRQLGILNVTKRNTGSISNATLNGNYISNSAAGRFLNNKFYYDYKTGKIEAKFMDDEQQCAMDELNKMFSEEQVKVES